MAKFKPAKIFKQAVDPAPAPVVTPGRAAQAPRHITSLSFDDRGETLVTAAEDETFRVYNCKTGKFKNTLFSKKYGVDLIRFTHKSTNVVHASTKEDDAIRYHSLHDNKYIMYFKGHKKKVISLEVSPVDDSFISGSLDRTVRLWDLRTPHARGQLNLPTNPDPIVAYDANGVIFAVAVNAHSMILLYDAATYDKAPFTTMQVFDPTLPKISFPPRPFIMTSLHFSPDQKFLLVGTSSDAHYIMDAFEGVLLAKLTGHVGLERGKSSNSPGVAPARGISGEEVHWTPDSKFVVGGSHVGKLMVWDIEAWRSRLLHRSGEVSKNKGNSNWKVPEPIHILPSASVDGHTGPSRCIRFNTRHAMLATAGAELAFWLPDPAGDTDKDGDFRMRGTY
ncbi:WD40 repeat-like protein [Auricularia subglabra TFB-10046 SS5]|nr:WD40 repeat-like protein [Auricularia subglabra TFB-10046 SS5]